MAYYHDGDVYCEACAPAGIEDDLSPGETDVPENCSECGRPCKYTLTGAGVEYVVDAILDLLDTWDQESARVIGPDSNSTTYYIGSPWYAVVADWALDLKDYFLSRKDEFIVDHFLERVRQADAQGTDKTDGWRRRARPS